MEGAVNYVIELSLSGEIRKRERQRESEGEGGERKGERQRKREYDCTAKTTRFYHSTYNTISSINNECTDTNNLPSLDGLYKIIC